MSLVVCLLLDDVSVLLEKLRATSDLSQRYQLEQQIGRIAKPAHLPLLLKEIDAGPAEIRPHWVRILRKIGGKDAIQALRGIATKYDWGCRGQAAAALKELGDDSGMKYLLAEFPKPTLGRDDRLQIASFLYPYYIEGKEVTAALRKVLETDGDEAVRSRVIEILIQHRDSDAAPLLRRIAASNSLRFEALSALIRLGDAEALEEALVALEKGPIAAASLTKVLHALQLAANATVVDRLRAVLERSKDSLTRTQVIRTLATLRDTKALSLLHKLAKEADAAVASAALDAILEMAGRSQIENLRKLLKHETADLRLRAAEALLALDDLSGLDVLRAELANESSAMRLRAVVALRLVRRKETVDLLIPMLNDQEANVRNEASRSLVSTLSVLYPYLRFDLSEIGYDPASEDAAKRAETVEKFRKWWEEHRK